MARVDYIPVSNPNNKTQPQMLLNFKNAVAAVLQQGPMLLDIMNHNFDDSNPQAINWAPLETLFGIPTGTGVTVFNDCNGIMGALQGTMQNSNAVDLVSRVG